MARPPRYAIRATIAKKGENAYIAKAVIECVDGEPPVEAEELAPCDLCSYPQARSAAYRFIAELSIKIRKAGGEVADVTIWEIPPATTEYHVTSA